MPGSINCSNGHERCRVWNKLSSLAVLVLFASSAAAQMPSSAPPRATVEDLALRARAAPHDADLLRRLAVAQAAAGQLLVALATIEDARVLAPDDLDIRLAQARILNWLGRRDEAQNEADAVAARDADYPELADVRAAIATPATSVTAGRAGFAASLGLASVDLPNGEEAFWTSFVATGFAPVGARATMSAVVDIEERHQTDRRLALRLDRRTVAGEVYAAVSATPKANFREQFGIASGFVHRVGHSIDASFDLRHARYTGVSVTVAEPGVRLRLANRKLVVSARWINLFRSDDGHRSGVAIRGDWHVNGDHVLLAGAATYPDTEAGFTRQVRSVYAGGVIPVSDRVSFRLIGEYEHRVASYTRRGVTISVVWRLDR